MYSPGSVRCAHSAAPPPATRRPARRQGGDHHAPGDGQPGEDQHDIGVLAEHHQAAGFERVLEQRGDDAGQDADGDGRKERDFLVFEKTEPHGDGRGRRGRVAAMIAQRHLVADVGTVCRQTGTLRAFPARSGGNRPVPPALTLRYGFLPEPPHDWRTSLARRAAEASIHVFFRTRLVRQAGACRGRTGLHHADPDPGASHSAILKGGDLLAGAQTGTGKTAGFTLPMLQLLSDPRRATRRRAAPARGARPGADPTRELAAQVEESVRNYGKYLKLRSMVMFGGVGINPQIDALKRGVDIVVATPGRLLDHVSQRTIDLSHIELLVLDEADRMLDMGFIHDIRKILNVLPAKRQNLLFSATFSDEIARWPTAC
jgi:hypothetical protein